MIGAAYGGAADGGYWYGEPLVGAGQKGGASGATRGFAPPVPFARVGAIFLSANLTIIERAAPCAAGTRSPTPMKSDSCRQAGATATIHTRTSIMNFSFKLSIAWSAEARSANLRNAQPLVSPSGVRMM